MVESSRPGVLLNPSRPMRRLTGIQIAGLASSEYGAAQLLLAAVSMGSNFTYIPNTGTIVGVMAGLSLVTGVVNSLSTYWMEKVTKSYVIFHVFVLVTCSIALLAKSEKRHNAAYVFTEVDSTSGWSPVGFAWLFGFLSVSWTMTDYDATAHITEEVSQPEIKAPWAISLAMAFTYIGGFLFNIALCFVMGDSTDILASPMEQPVAQIFFKVLGKGGGSKLSSPLGLCSALLMDYPLSSSLLHRKRIHHPQIRHIHRHGQSIGSLHLLHQKPSH